MNTKGSSETLCILFSDTMGIQWADTDATPVYVCAYMGALANMIVIVQG